MGQHICVSHTGLVLLSADLRVIGMNEPAKAVLGLPDQEIGRSVLDFHSPRSRSRLRALLEESHSHPDMPVAMIIDYSNRAVLISVSLVSLAGPEEFMYAVTFSDVSEQVGAQPNPGTGMVELRKFPVCSRGSVHFLDTRAIYFIRSDGNYCRIFTEKESYHLHFSLKNLLSRYAGLNFLRVHKSYVVNTDLVQRIEKNARGHMFISFGQDSIPLVPLARRKIHDLRRKMGLTGSAREF